MTFRSILFDGLGEAAAEAAIDGAPPARPDSFADLRLDQIVAEVAAGREALDLGPFFHEPLGSVAAIRFRHEVFRDLEQPAIGAAVRRFTASMAAMRQAELRIRRSGYALEAQRWTLSARERYCEAVTGLADALAGRVAAPAETTAPGATIPRSAGLTALADYLDTQVQAGPLATLLAGTGQVVAALAGVGYRLQIAGTRIRVSRALEPEADYGAEVSATFERFRHGSLRTFAFQGPEGDAMNRLEAEIAARVARLFPDVFEDLATYCAAHADFVDPTIARFDREVQLYVAWLEHLGRLRSIGLGFCYPEVAVRPAAIEALDVFDLALAARRARDGETVVANSLEVRHPERIVVISGPNQGGKTTFARAIGQLHHLAGLGLPVPGTSVRLGLVDRIFTHFEREEDLLTQTSKLEDELLRLHDILALAGPDSLIILNESFGSTSLADALAIGRDVLVRVQETGALCVFVTFLDELASLGPAVASMVSTVDAVDPAVRTFRIVRQAADGLAYADALARKHRLTEADVRARLAS